MIIVCMVVSVDVLVVCVCVFGMDVMVLVGGDVVGVVEVVCVVLL